MYAHRRSSTRSSRKSQTLLQFPGVCVLPLLLTDTYETGMANQEYAVTSAEKGRLVVAPTLTITTLDVRQSTRPEHDRLPLFHVLIVAVVPFLLRLDQPPLSLQKRDLRVDQRGL